jgi:DNA-binding NtrC family response regulator
MRGGQTNPTLFDTAHAARQSGNRPAILLVAAGKLFAEEHRRTLLGHGLYVEVARSVADAMERLTAKRYEALVLQWRTLEVEFLGREWREGWQRCVHLARKSNSNLVLVVQADTGTRIPEEAARLADWVDRGTVDGARLARAIPLLEPPPRAADWLAGVSAAAQNLLRLVEAVAPRQAPVLITGESGAGKSHVAALIHRLRGPEAGELHVVPCRGGELGGLPTELAGEAAGSKSARAAPKPGRPPAGSVYLDAVEALSIEEQDKLLHLLEREADGGPRWMASTSADLHIRVAEGRFLAPLLYRLAVYPIVLTPLRERLEDVPALLDYFLKRICERDRLAEPAVGPEVVRGLMQQSWPGNLRELSNAVEFAVLRAAGRRELLLEDFPLGPREKPASPAAAARLTKGETLRAAVTRFERTLIEQALAQSGGNRRRAAALLGVKRTTLVEKLRRFDRAP